MPYFDYNATTPLSLAARDAWVKASEEAWQNPSSPHRAGVRAGLRLQAAREKVAMVLGCKPERIEFTGGATAAAPSASVSPLRLCARLRRHRCASIPMVGHG